MSIFNRDKIADQPQQADGSLDLPVDYDDETSPYFVPEHLRERWKKSAGLADTTSHLQGTVQVIAEHRAWKSARPELFVDRIEGMTWSTDEHTGTSIGQRGITRAQPPHLLSEASVLGLRGAHLFFAVAPSGADQAHQIIASESETLIAEAEHAMRLHHVQVEYEYEQREAELAYALDARNLCPVCNVSSIETGAPSVRDIAPSGSGIYGRRISIHSCAGCYLAAVAILTERLARRPLEGEGTETREQRVRVYLEAQGTL